MAMMCAEYYGANIELIKLIIFTYYIPGLLVQIYSRASVAILDFAHTGHQGATPTCMQCFFKTLCPYLTPCQIAKTCHQVCNFSEFYGIFLFLPLSYRGIFFNEAFFLGVLISGKAYFRISGELA